MTIRIDQKVWLALSIQTVKRDSVLLSSICYSNAYSLDVAPIDKSSPNLCVQPVPVDVYCRPMQLFAFIPEKDQQKTVRLAIGHAPNAFEVFYEKQLDNKTLLSLA